MSGVVIMCQLMGDRCVVLLAPRVDSFWAFMFGLRSQTFSRSRDKFSSRPPCIGRISSEHSPRSMCLRLRLAALCCFSFDAFDVTVLVHILTDVGTCGFCVDDRSKRYACCNIGVCRTHEAVVLFCTLGVGSHTRRHSNYYCPPAADVQNVQSVGPRLRLAQNGRPRHWDMVGVVQVTNHE